VRRRALCGHLFISSSYAKTSAEERKSFIFSKTIHYEIKIFIIAVSGEKIVSPFANCVVHRYTRDTFMLHNCNISVLRSVPCRIAYRLLLAPQTTGLPCQLEDSWQRSLNYGLHRDDDTQPWVARSMLKDARAENAWISQLVAPLLPGCSRNCPAIRLLW
jgi:hypothetical protein